MSTRTATLDAPSLTLPDWRTALKRRIKRPKLPDRQTRFMLAWGAFWLAANVAVGLIDHSLGNLVCAGAISIDLGRIVHHCWLRERPLPSIFTDPVGRVVIALWLASIAMVIAGV